MVSRLETASLFLGWMDGVLEDVQLESYLVGIVENVGRLVGCSKRGVFK